MVFKLTVLICFILLNLQMFKYGTTLLAMASAAMADKTIIIPPADTTGTQVAFIMINGADCDPAAYEPLMKEF